MSSSLSAHDFISHFWSLSPRTFYFNRKWILSFSWQTFSFLDSASAFMLFLPFPPHPHLGGLSCRGHLPWAEHRASPSLDALGTPCPAGRDPSRLPSLLPAFYPPSFLPTFKESLGPVLSMFLRYLWSASVCSRFGDARIGRQRLRLRREDRVTEVEAPVLPSRVSPRERGERRHKRGRLSERLWLGPMLFLSPSWIPRVWVSCRVSEPCGSALRVPPFPGSAVAQPCDKSCRMVLLVPALEKPKFLPSVHRSPLRLV